MAILHPTSIEARRLLAETLLTDEQRKALEAQIPKVQRYEFTVTMAGYGKSQEEAWQDACAEFALNPGEPCDEVVVTDEDFDGQDPGEDISDEGFPARAAQMVENIDAYVAATGQACGFKLFDMMPPCVLIAGHEGIHTDGFGGHYGQYDAAIAEEEREAEDNARAADQD